MTIIAQLLGASVDRDYTWLKGAVANWMHRTNLTADIPDCIMLAETRIKALLEAKLQDLIDTISTVPGQQTVSLPAALLRIHSLSIANVSPVIDYVTPEQLAARYIYGEIGYPRKYTTIGNSLYFGPIPDAAYPVTIVYQASMTPLSLAEPINALLALWPNVYLWGSLVEAAKFSRDKELQAGFNADFAEAIAAVNLADWHNGGPLTVRSDVRSV